MLWMADFCQEHWGGHLCQAISKPQHKSTCNIHWGNVSPLAIRLIEYEVTYFHSRYRTPQESHPVALAGRRPQWELCDPTSLPYMD
jgi:hypothetical protein